MSLATFCIRFWLISSTFPLSYGYSGSYEVTSCFLATAYQFQEKSEATVALLLQRSIPISQIAPRHSMKSLDSSQKITLVKSFSNNNVYMSNTRSGVNVRGLEPDTLSLRPTVKK